MSEAEGESHTVVGIDWDRRPEEPRVKKILDSLARAVHPLLTGSNYLDFMMVEGSLDEAIRKCGKPLLGR